MGKRRSFWPYAFKCLFLVGVAGGVGGYFFYRQFQGNLESLLEEENLRSAKLAARILGEGLELARLVPEVAAVSDARVTVVGLDGKVLADSDTEPAAMENHAARPEIEEALRNGFAHAIRHSATLNMDMLYTAVRVDGPQSSPRHVVRLARTVKRIENLTLSFSELVWTAIPLVAILGVLTFYLLIEVRIARS